MLAPLLLDKWYALSLSSDCKFKSFYVIQLSIISREAIVDTFARMIKKYDLKESNDPIMLKADVRQQQEAAEGLKRSRGVSDVGV